MATPYRPDWRDMRAVALGGRYLSHLGGGLRYGGAPWGGLAPAPALAPTVGASAWRPSAAPADPPTEWKAAPELGIKK